MPYPKEPKGRAIDGHDGPVYINQFKNSPTQSELTQCGDQQDVPYKSSAGTPNANVDPPIKR